MSSHWILGIALAVIVLTCTGLWFGGRWLARRLEAQGRDAIGLATLTPTGYLVYGVMVVAFCGGLIVREFARESAMGALLNTRAGFAGYFIGCMVVLVLVELVLKRRGYPMLKAKKDRAV
jgi:hypothetical protein